MLFFSAIFIFTTIIFIIKDDSAIPLSGQYIMFNCSKPYSTWDDDQIYLVKPDGSNLTRVPTKVVGRYSQLDWSPDSKWIALSYQKKNQNFNIVLMQPDGDNLHRLTDSSIGSEFSPTWSPDGKWIAYLTDYPQWQINIASLDGKIRNTILVDGIVPSSEIVWSPNDDWIAFHSKNGIYRVHSDGTNLQKIVSNSNFTVSDWSIKEQLLLTSLENTSLSNLVILSLEKDIKIHNITRYLQGNQYSGNFSQDGDYIVFTSTHNDFPPQLYILETQTNTVKQLTNLECTATSPTWSPIIK